MTGHLFYFMGASGVGKDTILDCLRTQQKEEFFFAVRSITRPKSANGEQHRVLSKAHFIAEQQAGRFLFYWQSHGFFYGIPQQVLTAIESGENAIVNGSRAYFHTAETIYPDIIPVLITAPESTILKRLAMRGRESHAEIQARFTRLQNYSLKHPSLITITNESTPEEAALQFIEKIQKYKNRI